MSKVPDAVTRYYEAWKHRKGDFSDVPLADDFQFAGPIASFSDAAGFREMAAGAGAAVTRFDVRAHFVDGDTVCSIIDWEMAMPGLGSLSSAELLEVRDGVIVRGEVFYDAQGLREAMATAEAGAA